MKIKVIRQIEEELTKEEVEGALLKAKQDKRDAEIEVQKAQAIVDSAQDIIQKRQKQVDFWNAQKEKLNLM